MYLGRAARGVQPRRAPPRRLRAARAELGIAPGRVRRRHRHAAARVEGQLVSWSTPRDWCSTQRPQRAVLRRRRRAASRSRSRRRRARSGSAIASCSPASRATSPRVVSAFDLSVFPSLWEGTPLTVFEALAMGKPIVATDADGLLDVLTRRARRAHRAEARRGGAGARPSSALIDEPETRARLGAARAAPGSSTTSPRSSARWSGCTTCCTGSRARRTGGACCGADLSFLTGKAPA